jgi:flagellar biosynthetic protein FliQ
MDTAQLLSLAREALVLMVLASAPPILSSLLVGFLMSLFQATTSLQESTLSTVPRLCSAVLALVLTGPWIGQQLSRFATQLLLVLPEIAS